MRLVFQSLLAFVFLILTACESEQFNYQNPNRYIQAIFDSVKVTNNINYKTARSIEGTPTELFFDFYEPYGDSITKRPLVILIHGGGFIQGHRGWMNPLALLLPKYGYACANISYRLYDGEKFPLSNEDFTESLMIARDDLISAINFFVTHASGIDPYKTDVDNILLAGASAGAITALHAVPLYIQNAEFDGLMPGPHKNIRGILSFAGAIMDTSWITPEYPAVFSVHGTDDPIVPFSEGYIKIFNIISPMHAYGSEKINQILSDKGKLTYLIPDEGAGHDNFLYKSELWLDSAILFLEKSLLLEQDP